MEKFYWREYKDKDGNIQKDITSANNENRVRELWNRKPKGELINVVELTNEEIKKNVISI